MSSHSEDEAPQSPLPEAGNDPNDPLRPEIEEENSAPTPPLGDPQQDGEVVEDQEELSDDESILSDIDDAEFDDFDPAAVAIEERPIAVDESNIGLIGTHKRKRLEEGDGSSRKKKREGRREKHKKNKKAADGERLASGEITRSANRHASSRNDAGDRPRVARKATPENEENLTPEERRKRALDRAMDEALKNPNKRRKRADGIDLEAQNDELIEDMRRRMTDAAKADTDARAKGQPGMEKLKLLPDVVALLNRNTLRDQLVDPDTNLLEAVRFFLEPLNDGSLPAFNIQRELFDALKKLPITKDSLVASGVGKVTLFYTKCQRAEPSIKRQAERLLGEWTRPILKRSDDYRKREFVEAVYDPSAVAAAARSSQAAANPGAAAAAAAAAARERQLAMPVRSNRARVEGGVQSYNIVPRSNVNLSGAQARSSGDDAFRKMRARQMARH